jgi:hypothetical protein
VPVDAPLTPVPDPEGVEVVPSPSKASAVNQLVVERPVRTTAAARTAARRGPAPAPGTPVREHELRSVVAVVAAVVGVLLLATWSFAQGWGRGPVVRPGELAVDGGIARVEGALSAARPQHAMPGMGTDEDPVADGDRRISVELTLLAGSDGLRYTADRFVLEVDGTPAERLIHRDVLPGDHLPAGTSLSGTLLFDVPVDATVGTLSYDGGPGTEVVLPAEAEQVSADHGPTADDPTHAGTTHDDAAAAGAGALAPSS